MSINLKQGFQYQNKIKTTIDDLLRYLSNSSNVMDTCSTHKKNKAAPSKEDEIVVAEKAFDLQTADVVASLLFLIKEREILTDAINLTKSKLGFNLDGQLSLNATKRMAIDTLKRMCNYKETTRITTGRDYVFNLEGNQTTYNYEIESVSTPNFDLAELKKSIKALEAETDEISNAIDEAYVNSVIEYTPIISVNDNMEEIIILLKDLICSEK